MKTVLVILALTFYAVFSLITFGTFFLDKRRAQLDLQRTPERTLHILSLLGGFPGALAAMAIVRHKNRKPMFVFITMACALLHALAWGTVLLAWLRFG